MNCDQFVCEYVSESNVPNHDVRGDFWHVFADGAELRRVSSSTLALLNPASAVCGRPSRLKEWNLKVLDQTSWCEEITLSTRSVLLDGKNRPFLSFTGSIWFRAMYNPLVRKTSAFKFYLDTLEPQLLGELPFEPEMFSNDGRWFANHKDGRLVRAKLDYDTGVVDQLFEFPTEQLDRSWGEGEKPVEVELSFVGGGGELWCCAESAPNADDLARGRFILIWRVAPKEKPQTWNPYFADHRDPARRIGRFRVAEFLGRPVLCCFHLSAVTLWEVGCKTIALSSCSSSNLDPLTVETPLAVFEWTWIRAALLESRDLSDFVHLNSARELGFQRINLGAVVLQIVRTPDGSDLILFLRRKDGYSLKTERWRIRLPRPQESLVCRCAKTVAKSECISMPGLPFELNELVEDQRTRNRISDNVARPLSMMFDERPEE